MNKKLKKELIEGYKKMNSEDLEMLKEWEPASPIIKEE